MAARLQPPALEGTPPPGRASSPWPTPARFGVPAGAPAGGPFDRLRLYLSCLRPRDILVLQGSPLLGAAFALGRPSVENLGPLALLAVANLCLVAHIFLLNDWSGVSADRLDANKAAGVFTARGAGRREIGVLTAALLALGLFLFGRLGLATLELAVGIAALSALYSLPRFNWKGRPLLNSVAHLLGGALHFLLGYSLGSALDRRGFALATFFALIFAAGHLTQEVRDHPADAVNGIRTNAVIFGRRRTFTASLVLFTLAQAILVLLALQGLLPLPLAGLGALHFFHLRWSREALAQGLTYASLQRLQGRYHALYAVIGLVLLASLWLGFGRDSQSGSVGATGRSPATLAGRWGGTEG